MKLYNIYDLNERYNTSAIARIAKTTRRDIAALSELLCKEIVEITREDFCPGETIHANLRKGVLVRDVIGAFSRALGLESIPSGLFDDLLEVKMYDDGDCTECGGDLQYIETFVSGQGEDECEFGSLYRCKWCGHYYLVDDTTGDLLREGKTYEDIISND